MAILSFHEIIRKHCDFLLSTIEYKIKFIKSEDIPSEDGVAYLYSNKTTIYIRKSRFDYLIALMPTGEPEFTQLSVLWVLKALSVDIATPESTELDINTFEGYVVFYTQLLREHCQKFITGDFSDWLRVLEFFIDETRIKYRQRTGKQLPKRIHDELEKYIAAKKLQQRYP